MQKTEPTGPQIYGTLALIQILFGVNFVTSKVVVSSISPFSFTFLRLGLSGLALWLILRVKGEKLFKYSKREYLHLAGLALLGMALCQTLIMWGLTYTSTINTAIITTTIPIFVLVVSILRSQEKLSTVKVISMGLSLTGVLILAGASNLQISQDSLVGDIMVLLSCLCLGLFISFSKSFFDSHDATPGTCLMLIFGSLFLLPLAILEWPDLASIPNNADFWASFLFSVFGATLVTYFLNNWVIKLANPGLVGLFIYLQPVTASTIAWLYLGEDISSQKLMVLFLILIGMAIGTVEELSTKKN